MTTSAWETYQLNNKNYQNSFDRQVQNLEVNNAVQREREIWNMASGVVGSTASNATSGAMIGGPAGALIGGAVGAGSSIFGGLRDLQLNDTLRHEAIDYTKDQFGYQLGNIKALPMSLSKVSAFNVDNKYFPFLEYYTCSEIEKEALKEKLKYNGMTLMKIDKLINYQITGEPTYMKGQLIRLETIQEDFHVINGIAEELNKGVFI